MLCGEEYRYTGVLLVPHQFRYRCHPLSTSLQVQQAGPEEGKRQRRSSELAHPTPPLYTPEPAIPFTGVFAATTYSADTPPRLMYLHDDCSGLDFLVDTGAAVSLFPHQSAAKPGPRTLRQADGSSLPSWGRRRFSLRFGGRDFSFQFLLAAVDRPILGVDFLAKNNWLVDIPSKQILDSTTYTPIFSVRATGNDEFVAFVDVPAPIQQLLDDFPEVVGATLGDLKPQHGVEHHIVTNGPPVHAKARRLDPVKLEAAREEFQRMEEAGIIRRSCSPWASPLHMVQKPDGSWRPCGDYRLLNAKTVPDRYPVPNVHDLSSRLHGATVFSKLDLVKGYFQVPMHPSDVEKTCVITPFGAFEWLFMPFGLRNAGNTFQRMMDRLGLGLPFVFIYLDDILIASPNMEEHKSHLAAVLKRLSDFGLIINPAKCLWAQSTVPFLGHEVTAAGVTPLTRHVRSPGVSAADERACATEISGPGKFLQAVHSVGRVAVGAPDGRLEVVGGQVRLDARDGSIIFCCQGGVGSRGSSMPSRSDCGRVPGG